MAERRAAVIVTGGAQGIGRGVTAHLLAQGYQVGAFDVDAEALAELDALPSASERLLTAQVDVTDEPAVKAFVARAAARFDGLDGLVNNAGIARPHNAPLEAFDLAEFERVLRTNLTGAFICAKAAASALRRSPRGAIVNIASTRALQSEPRSEAYAAAKGGMLALTHALALSLAGEVRVNAISPGWIDVSALKKASARRPSALRPVDHAQHPAGRVGRAEDIAHAVQYLLSPEAGFVTGQNFVVDGGMTVKMQYAE